MEQESLEDLQQALSDIDEAVEQSMQEVCVFNHLL